ncbi:MAG TPA: hypothetical protein VIU41_05790 [Geobacteraceae bacterium]
MPFDLIAAHMNTLTAANLKRFAAEKRADLVGIAPVDGFAGYPEGKEE